MRQPVSRMAWALWLAAWGGLVGCAEDGRVPVAKRGAAARGAPAPEVDSSASFGTLREPLLLNPDGPYLVSPRPSPDGRWVAAAGRGGIGLYVLPSDGSARPRALDAGYRGPRAWTAGPVALHFGHFSPRAWLPDRDRMVDGRSPWRTVWDEELGQFLGGGPAGSVYHHPRLGTVTLVRPDGSLEVRGDERAWGARLSPDGRRVAWCTGNLAAPRMYLWRLANGRTRSLGAGAQPAWAPDGESLVFTRPLELRRFGGRATVVRAELWRWQAARPDRIDRIPTRTGHAPMEPVLGPQGRTLYYADWRDGHLYRAALPAGGGVR